MKTQAELLQEIFPAQLFIPEDSEQQPAGPTSTENTAVSEGAGASSSPIAQRQAVGQWSRLGVQETFLGFNSLLYQTSPGLSFHICRKEIWGCWED